MFKQSPHLTYPNPFCRLPYGIEILTIYEEPQNKTLFECVFEEYVRDEENEEFDEKSKVYTKEERKDILNKSKKLSLIGEDNGDGSLWVCNDTGKIWEMDSQDEPNLASDVADDIGEIKQMYIEYVRCCEKDDRFVENCGALFIDMLVHNQAMSPDSISDEEKYTKIWREIQKRDVKVYTTVDIVRM